MADTWTVSALSGSSNDLRASRQRRSYFKGLKCGEETGSGVWSVTVWDSNDDGAAF